MILDLVRPSLERLPAFMAALGRGWSPDNVRGPAAAKDILEIARNHPEQLIAHMDDREARAGPIRLPDGTEAERLPGYHRWLWDGEFCGSIGLRWRPGTGELPPHVLGHIGYAVVPWKRGQGYATEALRLLLPEAAALGLPFVDLTTEPENLASKKIILSNGGYLVETFTKPDAFGGGPSLRYRIDLPRPEAVISR
jgi:predicted acetyltransferase